MSFRQPAATLAIYIVFIVHNNLVEQPWKPKNVTSHDIIPPSEV